MRIGQVMKATGLGKKTIRYYIQQGLLAPKAESSNRYLDFTEEDVERLRQIKLLRQLDFPVVELRQILDYPETARYYLIRRQKEILREKKRMEWQETQVELLLDRLPMIPGAEALQSVHLDGMPQEDQDALDMVDAYLLVNYFVGTFMHEEEMTDYRLFLLDKLRKQLVAEQSPAMMTLRDYCFGITPQQSTRFYIENDAVTRRIAGLMETEYDAFTAEMCRGIAEGLASPSFLREWQENYRGLYSPSTAFFGSETNRAILKELSPRFAAYQKNILRCCQAVYDHLHTPEGQPLLHDLTSKLQGWIDLEHYDHAELATLFLSLPYTPTAAG